MYKHVCKNRNKHLQHTKTFRTSYHPNKCSAGVWRQLHARCTLWDDKTGKHSRLEGNWRKKSNFQKWFQDHPKYFFCDSFFCIRVTHSKTRSLRIFQLPNSFCWVCSSLFLHFGPNSWRICWKVCFFFWKSREKKSFFYGFFSKFYPWKARVFIKNELPKSFSDGCSLICDSSQTLYWPLESSPALKTLHKLEYLSLGPQILHGSRLVCMPTTRVESASPVFFLSTHESHIYTYTCTKKAQIHRFSKVRFWIQKSRENSKKYFRWFHRTSECCARLVTKFEVRSSFIMICRTIWSYLTPPKVLQRGTCS